MLTPALILHLLVSANDHCYVVTNKRIAKLPTCDFGAATAEMLTEEATPDSATAGGPPRRYVPRGSPGWSGCTTEVRGNDELEHRLAQADEERLTAVSRRVTAEQQRDEALRERDRAITALEHLRKATAAALGQPGHLRSRRAGARRASST
jgi:hypothetical protein